MLPFGGADCSPVEYPETMHRRLIVTRHAKSSWKDTSLADHERPLNKRGRGDAPRVAARLTELDWVPDRVVSSTAMRTRETWQRMADVFGTDVVVSFHGELYGAGMGSLRQCITRNVDDDARTLLCLGHNPGWEEVASRLADEYLTMTTGNAVCLQGFGATWADALDAPWELVHHILPREI